MEDLTHLKAGDNLYYIVGILYHLGNVQFDISFHRYEIEKPFENGYLTKRTYINGEHRFNAGILNFSTLRNHYTNNDNHLISVMGWGTSWVNAKINILDVITRCAVEHYEFDIHLDKLYRKILKMELS